jgi:hypothetical protein
MATMSGYRYAAPLSLRPNRDGTKYGVPGIAFPIYRVTDDNPVLDEQRGWTRQECLDRLDPLRTAEKELAGVPEREIVRAEINRLENLLGRPLTQWV